MADQGDDEVVELDPEERYYRYKESVGKGRFKSVFKAFDTQLGIDVAWSKINTAALGLSEEQLAAVARDIQKGLELDHPNIIRCFKCWESADQQCINLITELFTSGNLRQYRNLHKHLDLKAVKRMARQILKGLEYLHGMQPPITHGDLRCDKIYVNGHSGEIKIGDLGLATLLPFRWQEQQQLAAGSSNGTAAAAPPATPPNPLMGSSFSPSSDIFAFGLCMLELLTLKQLDPQHCPNIQALVAEVQDDECRQFVAKCVAPPEERPTAVELLEHPFLVLKKPQQQQGQGGGGGGGGGGLGAGGTGGGGTGGGGGGGGAEQDLGASLNASSRNLRDALDKRRTEEQGGSEQDGAAPIAVGKLRGEDYNFEFHGKVKDGKMHFRLVMTEAAASSSSTAAAQQGGEGAGELQPFVRTIDFVFDPEIDTADNLAHEISENFNLSPTDTEICAAALREWLAKEMPGTEGAQK